MSHSNSSLNCFANCMAKYEHSYVLHTPPCKPLSPHLPFGTMAHEVLEKAGRLRDETEDGVVDKDAYYSIIPSEVLYPELKTYFNISSWEKYFTPIIKQVAQYERELRKDIVEQSGKCEILREVKLQMTPNELLQYCSYPLHEPLVGIVDLLLLGTNCATIMDYKFSTKTKGQDEFDMNSQLQVYALLVHHTFGIPLRNVKIGYIDIPKQEFGQPTLLTNGTLSRAKSQNISQEMYQRAVLAVHGDDAYYNCEPGGYYYDAWCNFANNKCAYLNTRYLELDAYEGIVKDILNAASMIDYMKDHKMAFLKKYDSYACKDCEYLTACKPWLTVGGDN